MAEQDHDRSQEATPYKLEQARKRGMVQRSPELNNAAVILWTALAVLLMGHMLVRDTLDLSRGLLTRAAQFSFSEDQVGRWLPDLFWEAVLLVMPFMLGTALVGIVANLVQSGPVFSTHPLKPDFERLNPVAGLKRIFSIRIIAELIKTIIKAVLLGTVLYFSIVGLLPMLARMFHVESSQHLGFLLGESGELLLRLAAVVAAVAVIDLIYTRWHFSKQMRMSVKDIRDEFKQREGDPRVRQKIRELQRETLKRASGLRKVKDADVLITNPRRLAIALQYRRGEMTSPKVVAKGAGEFADQIRLLARRYRVPIIENRKLARALFRECGIEQSIKEKYFPEVARILVWALALRRPAESQHEAAL